MNPEPFLERNRRWMLFALIPVLGVLMHWDVWTKPLVGAHVWRQTQTQINIENFAFEDFNLLRPRIDDRGTDTGIFRMEFPIMQWLFAAVYKGFGNHLILSRVLSWIIALFSVWGMYALLFTVFERRATAVAGAWAFHFSPLLFYFSVNPMPDNFALCCSVWGMAFFFRWVKKGGRGNMLLSAFFLSLGALSKLPFVVCFAPVFFHLLFQQPVKKTVKTLPWFVSALVPVAAWYATVIPQWHGNGIVQGMFENRKPVGELADIAWGHLISTLPELCLNYASVLFFLAGFYVFFKTGWQNKPFAGMLLAWSAAVLAYFFFELNQIGREHDYYLFPFFPLLFLLVAGGIQWAFTAPGRFWRLYVPLALAVMPLTAFLRVHPRWSLDKPGFNKDLLVHREALQRVLPDTAVCLVGNDASHNIWFYYLDKKGWAFVSDHFDGKAMADRIGWGARYLYCDDRALENRDDIRPQLDSLLAEHGSIRVWKLAVPNR